MKFSDALEHISKTKDRITREGWGYTLYFDRMGALIVDDGPSELTPYCISIYDFNYDWTIVIR